jgi:hypothetical protein
MKEPMVRVRISPELEVEAVAARLYRAQSPVRVVSGKHLWAMKRKAQKRDRELAARGEVPPAAMLLLRPNRLQSALIEWPDAPLVDD